ncbi:phosphoglycerate mutase-like protein [Xylariaceae sp. FL1019]|nr:phosphoglycerate mutase-like protein [Xylariaceae sp. FL1019]
MAPIVILIRHAQALHNVDDNWEIFDPALTDQGISQCKALSARLEANFPYPKEECRIIVSPLTRTLETVQHSLGWLLDSGVPVEVRAEWQETTANPCDIGAPRAEIEAAWPDFDFTSLDPVYPEKTGFYDPSEEALLERAAAGRQWLAQQKEKCIVVVTHSGFLVRVIEGPRFKNTEYRAYEVVDDQAAEGDVRLVQLMTNDPEANKQTDG